MIETFWKWYLPILAMCLGLLVLPPENHHLVFASGAHIGVGVTKVNEGTDQYYVLKNSLNSPVIVLEGGEVSTHMPAITSQNLRLREKHLTVRPASQTPQTIVRGIESLLAEKSGSSLVILTHLEQQQYFAVGVMISALLGLVIGMCIILLERQGAPDPEMNSEK